MVQNCVQNCDLFLQWFILKNVPTMEHFYYICNRLDV